MTITLTEYEKRQLIDCIRARLSLCNTEFWPIADKEKRAALISLIKRLANQGA